MRKGKWKLIEFLVSGGVELYDLESDLAESVNLAKEYPEVSGSMLSEMRLWRREENVPLPPAARMGVVR